MSYDKKHTSIKLLLCVAVALAAVFLIGAADKLGDLMPPGNAVSSVSSENGYSQQSAVQSSSKHSGSALQSGGEPLILSTEVVSEPQTTAVESEAVPQSAAPPQSGVPETPRLRFRSRKLLDQHYEKHGVEMGFSSAEEYEAAAAAVAENPEALRKTEAEDGDDVYYIESTNEFVIVSADGYLRTYFNPDRGIDYFNKQ